MADKCSIAAGRIGDFLEKSRQESKDFQSTQRNSTTPSDGGSLKTRDGFLLSDFGPDVVPFDSKEKIALISNVGNMSTSGNQLAALTNTKQMTAEIRHLQDMQWLDRSIKGLTPAEQINVFEVSEGRPWTLDEHGRYAYERGSKPQIPMNERVARAADNLKEYFRRNNDIAQKIGLKDWKAEDYYIPIMHETSVLKQAKFRDQYIQGLAKDIARRNNHATVQPEDIGAAEKLFNHDIGQQFAKVGGNIMRHREADIGAERVSDLNKVMNLYTKQFWNAVEEQRIFGSRKHLADYPEKVYELMGKIAEETKGDPNAKFYVDALVQDEFGIHPANPIIHGEIVRTLGSLQALKLSMSSLRNLASGQINTVFKTGLKPTMKAIDALVFNRDLIPGLSAREARGMLGSVIDQGVREANLYQGGEGFIDKMAERALNYSQMTRIEKVNRSIAGLSGAFLAQQQAEGLIKTGAKRYAERLTELGIDPERVVANNGKLELIDQLIAGQRVIDTTQGRSRLSDLPAIASMAPDFYKAVMQFRNVAVMQTRLMVDQARRRPVRTALFGAAIMPAVGMGVSFLYDTARYDIAGMEVPQYKKDQDSISNYLEGAAAAGSWGLISDLAYAGYMAGDAGSFRSFIQPPIMSTFDDSLTMLGDIFRGNYREYAFTVGRQFGGLGSAFVHLTGAKDLPKSWEDF